MATNLKLKDLLLQQKIKGAERRGISAAKKAGKSKADAVSYARAEKLEHLRRDCIGLVLTWTDRNPLGDGGCDGLPKATSLNPCPLTAAGVVESFLDPYYRNWIIEQEFAWSIDIELYFALPNHKSKNLRMDPIQFTQRGAMKDPLGDLSGINSRIERAIMYSLLVNQNRPDGDKNKGVFEKAVYRISCVGL